MKKSLLFISIPLLVLQLGCRDKARDFTECKGYVEYPQMLKDLCLFKDSSYWIYKEKTTGVLDSIFTQPISEIKYWPYKQTGTRDCPCYQIFVSSYFSTYYGLRYELQMDAHYDSNPIDKSNLQFEVEYKQRTSQKYEYRFVTFGYDSLQPLLTPGTGNHTRFKDITVLGKTYNNPLYFFYTNPTTYDWIRNAYDVPKVGIVKYEHEDGKVWELLRYSVRQ